MNVNSGELHRTVAPLAIRTAQLSTPTFCTLQCEFSSLRRPRRRTARNDLERLSGVNEQATIVLMTTTGRAQQYDHSLRNLVRRTRDVTIATDLGGSSLDGPWPA